MLRLVVIAWLCAVLGGGAGCARHYRVVVLGRDLHAAGPELRAHGKAIVRAKRLQGDHERVWLMTETIAIDQQVKDGRKVRWVRDLLRGCSDNLDDAAANTDCELAQYYADAYTIRGETDYSVRQAATYTITAVIAAGLVGALACTAACDHDNDYYTPSLVTVGVTGGLLAGALLWAIIGCFGHWGDAGCRD